MNPLTKYEHIYHPISGKKYLLNSRKGRAILVSLVGEKRQHLQYSGESPAFSSTLQIRQSEPNNYDPHDVCSNNNCAPIGDLQDTCAPDNSDRVAVNPATL